MNKLIIILFLFIFACKDKKEQEIDTFDTANSIPEIVASVPLLELILDSKEVDNSKIDNDFSWVSENNISVHYIKTLNQFQKRHVDIEITKFDDNFSSQYTYTNNKIQRFSKFIPDEMNGGTKKNRFFSKRIPIENLGDSSYCYEFVGPTVVVLYKNFILECDVNIEHVYENISEDNSSTLAKTIKLLKKQIKKIDDKGL